MIKLFKKKNEKEVFEYDKKIWVEVVETSESNSRYEFVMIRKNGIYFALNDRVTNELLPERFTSYKKLPGQYYVASTKYEEMILDGNTGKIVGGNFDKVESLPNGYIIVKFQESIDKGWAIFNPETQKTMRLRFDRFEIEDYADYFEWTAAYLANKDKDGVYFNKEGKLMRAKGAKEAYGFVKVHPFENKYFTYAVTSYQNNPSVFVYSDGSISAEKFIDIRYVYDDKGVVVGARASFDGENYMEVEKQGKVTSRSWLNLIEKEPATFKYIPTVRFMDEEFVSDARRVAMSSLEKKLRTLKNVTEENIKEFETLIGNIDSKITKEKENIEKIKKLGAEKLAEERQRQLAEEKVLEERLQKETEQSRLAREQEEMQKTQSLKNKKIISNMLSGKKID